MNKTISLQLVTPEKTLATAEVDSVTLLTSMGQITVLPNHAPLVAALIPGEAKTTHKGKENTFHVAGGFVKIESSKDATHVVVLADAAEHSDDIDEARAKVAMQRAKEQMSAKLSEEEYVQVAAALERSLARLRLVRKKSSTSRRSIGLDNQNNMQ